MKQLVSLALGGLLLLGTAFADPKIIYPGEKGRVISLTPITSNNFINETTGEWMPLSDEDPPPVGYRRATVEDIARKDVPPGKPWKIIDSTELAKYKRPTWARFNKEPK